MKSGLGSAVVSTAFSRRLADWVPLRIGSLFDKWFLTFDAFGETLKATVETTALPFFNRMTTVAGKKTRRRDANECDRDGRAPQSKKCVAMTFLESL
jgi:hypothetical protein